MPEGTTIWTAAQDAGIDIPVLCHDERYDPVGVCRMCVVDVGGARLRGRVRAPVRGGHEGHDRHARGRAQPRGAHRAADGRPAAARARTRRRRRPATTSCSRWPTATASPRDDARCRAAPAAAPTSSNPVIAVDHDACILCDRCVRACDDIQGNDVIGRTGKGYTTRIAFDLNDPMGESSCVTCGECVAACPTGRADQQADPRRPDPAARRSSTPVDSVCPYCGVGCALTYYVDRERGAIAFAEGRDQPGLPGPAVRQGPLRLGLRRLAAAADDAADPARRLLPEGPAVGGRARRGGRSAARGARGARPGGLVRLRRGAAALPRGHLGRGARPRRATADARSTRRAGPAAIAGFGSAKCSNEEAYLFQKLIRTGFGTNNVDHCTRLCHASSVAALFEGIGSGRRVHDLRRRRQRRRRDHRRHATRPPTTRSPSSFFKQARRRGTKIIYVDPRGRPDRRARRHLLPAQARHRRRVLQRGDARGDPARAGRRGVHRRAAPRTSTRWRRTVADYPPERAEQITGVRRRRHPRGRAALGRGAAPAIIFWGMGISQHTTGTDNARCLIAHVRDHRQRRPARHRAAPAARPEQRAGRLGRRA